MLRLKQFGADHPYIKGRISKVIGRNHKTAKFKVVNVSYVSKYARTKNEYEQEQLAELNTNSRFHVQKVVAIIKEFT